MFPVKELFHPRMLILAGTIMLIHFSHHLRGAICTYPIFLLIRMAFYHQKTLRTHEMDGKFSYLWNEGPKCPRVQTKRKTGRDLEGEILNNHKRFTSSSFLSVVQRATRSTD